MSCLHYNNNELHIENISLKQIANELGTPCYIYSRQQIEKNWQTLNNAFAKIPHRICYAVKANPNIAILNLLARLGSGFDIVSGGELERVLIAKGDASNIVFSGVGKTTTEISNAIQKNIFCIDIESTDELIRVGNIAEKLNKKVNIALRINPNINPNTHAHISTGLKENKFGIELEETISTCQQVSHHPALNLIGVACHIGSQITSLEPYHLMLDQLTKIYHELQSHHIPIKYINIGGGLGISYQQEKTPTIDEYAALIIEKLSPLPIELIIEPGRTIIGNAGVLLTKIDYLKHNRYHNFAIVDAGMNDLMRPALYDAYHPILPVVQRQTEKMKYDIAGPVCESADILAKQRELALESGDLLVVDLAGAYGTSMSSNYNSRCLPAEVLVDNNKIHIIRKRQTFQQMISNEHIMPD